MNATNENLQLIAMQNGCMMSIYKLRTRIARAKRMKAGFYAGATFIGKNVKEAKRYIASHTWVC